MMGKKHGMIYTPEYAAWAHMLQRCTNPKDKRYKHYGGRGIKVCDRWRNSFVDFLTDVGARPSEAHTLDRKDTNRGYEPGNCEWATQKAQQRNRRNNTLLTYRGKTQCVAAWAEEYGLKQATLVQRLYRSKWPLERVLTEPLQPNGWRRIGSETC